MKFLFVFAHLGTAVYVNKHEAKYSLLIVRHLLLFCLLLQIKIWHFVLFAEARIVLNLIVLNLFLNFEQKWASCSYKIVLIKNVWWNKAVVEVATIGYTILTKFRSNSSFFKSNSSLKMFVQHVYNIVAFQVKVVGSGLSPSDIACTNDYMISMENFNRVLNVDKDNHRITIEAGMKFFDIEYKVFL